MVTVNTEKCIGCGLCAADCVGKVIAVENGKAKVAGKCILCGHCVAICPTKAPVIEDYDDSEVMEYDRATFDVMPDNLMNTMKFRRSIRQFKDAPVPVEKLQKALEAGRYAPTGVNMQDVRFVVVRERMDEFKRLVYEGWRLLSEELSKTNPAKGARYMGYYEAFAADASADRLFLNAPVLVAFACDMPVNGGIAAAYTELMLHCEGLGALFNGYVELAVRFSEAAREFLDIGDKKLITTMLVGVPNVKYRRTVPRRKADVKLM